MPTKFQVMEADFAAVVTAIQCAVDEIDKLAEGDGKRAVLESLVARLGAAEKTLADMAPTRQKQGAKAAVPKPQRLINDATADAIIAFGTKYDTAVDDLAKKHLPHATALLAALPLPPAPVPEPEPEPEPVAAPVKEAPSSVQVTSAAKAPAVQPTADIDPELAAALSMSMEGQSTGGAAAPPPTAPAASVPAAKLPAGTKPAVAMAAPRAAAAPSGTTAVRVRLIKTGAEMDLAVPEGADNMPVKDFRQLVAAVYGIEAIESTMLIAAGKQLKDTQTLTEGGIKAGLTVFVGVDPKAAKASSGSTLATPAAAAVPSAAAAAAAPTAAAAAAAEENPAKAALVAAMVKAVTTMKAATDYVSLVAAVRTVVKLLGNLVKHPGDSKFTKVKTGNVLLKTRLLSKPGGLACLEAVGFRKDATGDFLVCDAPHEHISDVKAMLDEALARWEL